MPHTLRATAWCSWHGILQCISGKEKSEEDDAYKIFDEFKEVFNKVNKTFDEPQQSVSEIKKKSQEDDEQCQWFFVSLMG